MTPELIETYTTLLSKLTPLIETIQAILIILTIVICVSKLIKICYKCYLEKKKQETYEKNRKAFEDGYDKGYNDCLKNILE